MFVATDPDAAPLGMAACEACSKKSDEEILDILRTEFAKQFGIDPTKPASVVGTHFAEMGTEQTVHGIKLAIVDGIRGEPCPQAMIFSELLERRALPRFVFAFRGHNNCIAITNQLYLDLRDLGIENRFTFKEGSSSSLKSEGADQPFSRESFVAKVSAGEPNVRPLGTDLAGSINGTRRSAVSDSAFQWVPG